MPLKYLPWDSEFFGLKIGRLEEPGGVRSIEKALQAARMQDFRCVYLELPMTALGTASDMPRAARLVDLKTTLRKDRPRRKRTASFICSDNPARHLPDFEAIGGEIAAVSRFTSDSRFSRKSRSLYRLWTRKSLSEGYCDRYYYAMKAGKPAGFITIRVKDGSPFIELLGVRRAFRGLGIGTELLKAAESWACRQGYGRLHVVTQGTNLEALQFYQSHGFYTSRVTLFYHCWL